MKDEKRKIENYDIDRSWKEKNKKYLKELQIFFDKADNIVDQDLRQSIISQMLICDKTVTDLAENMFKSFYQKGINDSKIKNKF